MARKKENKKKSKLKLLKRHNKNTRFNHKGFNQTKADNLLHKNNDTNSIKQKLASYVRTQETYELEINNFNKEISSLDNYHGKELVTLGTTKVKYIHKIVLSKIEEESLQLNEMIKSFKAKINERNLNLQQFLIGKSQLLQFNEAQLNTLKAYFNVEIENMRKRIVKLNEENKELISKCSQHEEHIKLLESTISCVSNERVEEKRGLSETYEKKLKDIEYQVEKILNEKNQILKQFEDSEKACINIVKHKSELEYKLHLNSEKIIELDTIIKKQQMTISKLQNDIESEKNKHLNEVKAIKQLYENKLDGISIKENKISDECLRLVVENEDYKKEVLELNNLIERITDEFKHREGQFRKKLQDETESNIKNHEKKFNEEILMLKKAHDEKLKIYEDRIAELERNHEKLRNDEMKTNESRQILFDQLKHTYDKSVQNYELELTRLKTEFDVKLKEIVNQQKSSEEQLLIQLKTDRREYEIKINDLTERYNELNKEYNKLSYELKKELEIKIYREKQHIEMVKKMRRRFELEKNCCL